MQKLGDARGQEVLDLTPFRLASHAPSEAEICTCPAEITLTRNAEVKLLMRQGLAMQQPQSSRRPVRD